MTDSTCSIEGCDGPRYVRGWCSAHYVRWRLTGGTGSVEVARRRGGRACSVDGCERRHQAQGWCQMHYQRWLATTAPSCSVEGCSHRRHSRGLCPAHYKRQRLTGDSGPAEIKLWAFAEGDGGYETAHRRIQSKRGKALEHACVECGGHAKEWAYDHAAPDERQEDLGPYSLDVFHYQPMCVPCHRRFDAGLRR